MENIRHWRIRKERYQLRGEICNACRAPIFPPRDVCPECHTGNMGPEATALLSVLTTVINEERQP